jgi:hypothetical protein
VHGLMQQDDHIWIIVNGTPWAIRRIVRVEGKPWLIDLWRGCEPFLQTASIDVRFVDWPAYCDAAVCKIAEGEERRRSLN